MRVLPTVIDVEASGFGAGSYPIEIGIALPSRQTHCFLIRPEPSWSHWDPKAERIHRIARDILAHHGLTTQVVAEKLNNLLSGEVVYSDSWGHDQSWLALLFDAAGRSQQFRVESLRTLFTEAQLPFWQQARTQALSEMPEDRHRASVDAALIQRSFMGAIARSEEAMASTQSPAN